MAWTANALRRPSRRRGDGRLAAPASATPPARLDVPLTPPGRGGPWAVLARELDRSRRYRHQLTLVRVIPEAPSGQRPPAARARREGWPGHRRLAPPQEILAALDPVLRAGDSAWVDGTAVYLLMPETDVSGAEAMIARTRAAVPAVAGATVRLACFPEHGLTEHALRAAVTVREQPASGDRLPALGPRASGPVPEGAD
jgi:hypothetical protein